MAKTAISPVRVTFSVNEAAAALGVTRDKVYDAIREGKLAAKAFGTRTLIPAAALEAFVNELPALTIRPDRAAGCTGRGRPKKAAA